LWKTVKLLGIDPGAAPTVCLLHVEPGKRIAADFWEADETAVAMRVNGHNRLECSPALMSRIIKEAAPQYVFLERALPRPGEGVSSVFRYARAYGICEAVCTCAGIHLQTVLPQVWKKSLELAEGKDSARYLASQMCPDLADKFERAKDHNRADAFLIAYYGWRKYFSVLRNEVTNG
jgi:Holliday junction resolvasome RuvABC endonuclease subunit